MNCIDTHIHIWNFDRAEYSWLDGNTSILGRSYLIEELEPQVKEAGVTAGVLVQAANTETETDYMLEVAAQHSWLKGVVGWLPLTKPDRVKELISEGYVQHPKFKGVRHLIHDEADPKWLLQPTVIESLSLLADAGIPYDVVGILPDHLKTVMEVAEKIPQLKMVLDHINQPPIKYRERFGEWGDLISEVAGHSNIYAKISGLGTNTGKGADWNKEDIKPYVEFTLQQFGSNRCFCGGDWPVSLLAGSYKHGWQLYGQTLSELLDESAQTAVLYTNAKDFYQL